MTFKRGRAFGSTELYLRQDIVNILQSLEPVDRRSGFEQGFLEALIRVGLACGIVYEPSRREDDNVQLSTTVSHVR